MLSYSSQHPQGTVISVRDRNGSALLEYTSEIAFTASGFSSPNFRTGETYTVFINGSRLTDIQLGSTITALSDNGGAYAAAGMGGRGGMMPGTMPPSGTMPPGGRGRW